MRALSLNLLLCAIITTTQIKLIAALFDTIPNTNVDQNMFISQQEQQQHLKRLHPSMSCHVCSTMDYENPTDNMCRNMLPQYKAPSLRQPNLAHTGFHSNPMMIYPSSTPTTTTTETNPTSDYNTLIPSSPEALVSSAQSYPMSQFDDSSSVQLESSTTTTTQSSQLQNSPHHDYNNSLSLGHNDDTKLVNPNTNTTHNQQQTQSKQQNSLLPVRRGPYPHVQFRPPPPLNYIRSRPCVEDENYCSIVSVVRIEFLSDNIVSRFWALERNCSKSCNTGCMIIGERVRLRVCSQCCRTPNCNFGSGASSVFTLDLTRLIILLLSLILFRHFMVKSFGRIEL